MSLRIRRGGLNRRATRQVRDAEVGAVLVAGEADGCDKGGALVDQNDKQEQVQQG